MTPEQYERWQDFALRMARTCYKTNRRPSGRWVVSVVEDWFLYFDADTIPCIVNWDNSTVYPEGNPSRCREYTRTYCGCDGWRHEHKHPNPDCTECRGSGVHHKWQRPFGVGDMISEFLDPYRDYHAPDCRVCREEGRGSCGERDYRENCTCDEIEDQCYEQWEDQWGSPVSCCIRAGLDTAVAPSGGVVGFTIGDLRKMYPEGVPEWVCPADEELQTWPNGGPTGQTFSEAPDETQYVL